MSRQDFKNFIRALEKNYSIRKEIKDCNSFKELINMAKKFGFQLNIDDIKEDNVSSEIAEWFNKSKITPIRK